MDERAKRAILLSFKVLEMVESNAGDFRYHDKMPLKSDLNGARVVPGAVVRWGSYLAPGSIVMPGFINIGGYLDSGSMLDTWATIGSCAQIGKNVHLSGGVGIGGVLEPANAVPVVVEDDAFIGSRSMVVEGRGCGGAKLAGHQPDQAMRVFDAETGEELPAAGPGLVGVRQLDPGEEVPGRRVHHPCLLMLRRLAAAAHDKTELNAILRDHGVERPIVRRPFRRQYGVFPPEHRQLVANVGRTMGGSNARRVRRQGPVTLRDKQIPATTTDQRLLDRRGPSDWVHADPWRVMRIQAEFVEGFGLLAELGMAVSVFGSAGRNGTRPSTGWPTRSPPDLSGRLRGDHRRRPGDHGGGQQGRRRGGRRLRRPRHRAADGVRPQRLREHRRGVPLLLRPQDRLHQVLAGLRGAPGRLRHDGRAVRGAHARRHREDHQVPDRPGRQRLLERPDRLAQGDDAGQWQHRPRGTRAVPRRRRPGRDTQDHQDRARRNSHK